MLLLLLCQCHSGAFMLILDEDFHAVLSQLDIILPYQQEHKSLHQQIKFEQHAPMFPITPVEQPARADLEKTTAFNFS